MSSNGSLPLQAAVRSALATALANAGSGGAAVPVLDEVPQGQAYPYVTIGEDVITDWSALTREGEDIDFTIHTWSRYAGFKEVKELMAAVKGALHDQALSVTGHQLVHLRLAFHAVQRDPDGKTRHGVQRFRALISEA